jgi:hypothetical protein
MIKYKIAVLTLQGKTFTFTVSKYEIVDGDFVEFIDAYTGEKKSFHASRCEIKEIEVESNG